jgi:hypothetical protein
MRITRREFIIQSGSAGLLAGLQGCAVGRRVIELNPQLATASTGERAESLILLPTSEVPRSCRVRHALFSRPNSRVANWTSLSLVRPQDLLTIRIELINVKVCVKHNVPYAFKLKGRRSFLIAHFPPQHIAEQAVHFPNYAEPPAGLLSEPPHIELPLSSKLAGASRLAFELPEDCERNGIPLALESLLDWNQLCPSLAPNALPPLDQFGQRWTHQCDPCSEDTFAYPRIRRPLPTETSIELPYHLMLSPHALSEWLHSKGLSNSRPHHCDPAVTELWHTRLSVRDISVTDPEFRERYPDLRALRAVRAIWWENEEEVKVGEFETTGTPCQDGEDVIRTRRALPDGCDRKQLSHLSSDYSLIRRVPPFDPIEPEPVEAERLMLSSLGATARLHGRWNPSLMQTRPDPVQHEFDVDEWRQDSIWGRDQFVLVSIKGYILPFGHEVSLLRVSERRFGPTSCAGNPQAAYLERKYFCQVRQPLMDYEAIPDGVHLTGRCMPFRRVVISPPRTPALRIPRDVTEPKQTQSSDPCANEGRPYAFWMYPAGGPEAKPFEFTIQAWDWSQDPSKDKPHVFRLPLLWVNRMIAELSPDGKLPISVCEPDPPRPGDPGNPGKNPDKFIVALNEYCSRREWRTALFDAQKVALVPFGPQNDGRYKGKDPALQVARKTFKVIANVHGPEWSKCCTPADQSAEQPGKFPPSWRKVRFYPALQDTEVKLDAVSRFAPAGATGTILAYNSSYLEVGFATGKNSGEVFADVVGNAPKLEFGGDRSGGLATPSIEITRLSRIGGPIGGKERAEKTALAAVNSDYRLGNFDPRDFFSGTLQTLPQLLGGIPLANVIAPIQGLADSLKKVPKLLAEVVEGISKVSQQLFDFLQNVATKLEEVINAVKMKRAEVLNSPPLANLRNKLNSLNILIEEKQQFVDGLLRADRLGEFDKVFQDLIQEAVDEVSFPREHLELVRRSAYEEGSVVVGKLQTILAQPQHILAQLSDFPEAYFRDLQTEIESTLDKAKGEFLSGLRAPIDLIKTELTRGFDDLKDAHKQFVDAAEQEYAAIKTRVMDEAENAAAHFQEEVRRKIEAGVGTIPAKVDVKLKEAEAKLENKIADFRSKIDALYSAVSGPAVGLVAEILKLVIEDFIPKMLSAVFQTIAGIYQQLLIPLNSVVEDVLKNVPKEIVVKFPWAPTLKSWGPFEASYKPKGAKKGEKATFLLETELREPLPNPLAMVVGNPPEIAKPTLTISGELKNCTLYLFTRSTYFVSVGLPKVSFRSVNGSGPDVEVEVGEVTFGGPLQYLAELAKELNPKSGPYLKLLGLKVETGFRLELPSLSFGAFSLTDLGFGAGLTLPFTGEEVFGRFAICERDQQFHLRIGILSGGGFFATEVGSKSIRKVEAAIEFGAAIDLDIGIAKGEAHVYAGIYFSMQARDVMLTGYVRAGGQLEIINLIHMTVEFYLGLTYIRRETHRGTESCAFGTVTVTVEIEIGFFSIGVDMTYTKYIIGSVETKGKAIATLGGESSFGDKPEYAAFPDNEWKVYQRAFAW